MSHSCEMPKKLVGMVKPGRSGYSSVTATLVARGATYSGCGELLGGGLRALGDATGDGLGDGTGDGLGDGAGDGLGDCLGDGLGDVILVTAGVAMLPLAVIAGTVPSTWRSLARMDCLMGGTRDAGAGDDLGDTSGAAAGGGASDGGVNPYSSACSGCSVGLSQK